MYTHVMDFRMLALQIMSAQPRRRAAFRPGRGARPQLEPQITSFESNTIN